MFTAQLFRVHNNPCNKLRMSSQAFLTTERSSSSLSFESCDQAEPRPAFSLPL